jgi:phosphoglycolate phosphatase-like HAD superfamily hydrolase
MLQRNSCTQVRSLARCTNEKAAIFDLEGTLIKLPIDYESLYRSARRELGVSKIQPLTIAAKKLNKPQRGQLFRIWEAAEIRALPNLGINKEGINLYRRFVNKPIALVTMQGKTIVNKIINRLLLKFTIVVTREDSLDREKQIKIAIDAIDIKPDNIIVVGDRDSDEAAATSVGCKFLKVKA